jgi:hypothetical protein
MSYRVETAADRRRVNDFIRLPHRIYRDDPHWVAPLNAEVRRTLDARRNPYFKHAELALFVCYDGRDALSRASVVLNRDHWKRFGERTAFFGFFESAADPEAAVQLFGAIESFCRARGAECLEGPFNPNHYSQLGLLADSYDSRPAFFESYNPAYYRDLLRHAGFAVEKRLHTRRNPDISGYVRERYGTPRFPARSGGFTVRTMNPRDTAGELERIREVFNDAFSDNWHFLRLTDDEYRYAAKFLRYVTYPQLIAIVERGTEPVGVVQCVLDVNPILGSMKGRLGPIGCLKYLAARGRVRDLVIYAVGIKRPYQHSRVYKLLLDSVCWMVRGSRCLTTTWMLDDNCPSIKAADDLRLKPYRHFEIYSKRI